MTVSTYSYLVPKPVDESIELDSVFHSRQSKKSIPMRSQIRPQPYLLIVGISILLMMSLMIIHVYQTCFASVRALKLRFSPVKHKRDRPLV